MAQGLHCNCMTTLWHPPGQQPEVLRTGRLGAVRGGPWPAAGVPALDAATCDQVCVVPGPALHAPDWPRLRVQLSRSGRLFLVEWPSGRSQEAVAAMRDGAFDVVGPGESRWPEAITAAVEAQKLWWRLYGGVMSGAPGDWVGRGEQMSRLRQDLGRLGPTDVRVLLLGESGVGKERMAAALHALGRGGPMVALNCAAMPRELLEAELFGVERGAFTGASRSRAGLVEQAAGGTLFLDEVGEMDLAIQPKLLRFLETRRARRVGGEREYDVSLRVVSATNRDLDTEVRAGRFRADLFYRLAEVVLRIPPLRERTEDIPELAQAFLSGAGERFGRVVERIEPGLLLKLQRHSWPGNVRELRSVIERLVLFHDGPVLREGWWDPPGEAMASPGNPAPASEPGVTLRGEEVPMPGRRGRLEQARRLMAEGRWSQSEIAARTGIHPTTLFRWRRSGLL